MFLTAQLFLLWTIGDVLDKTWQLFSKGRPGGISISRLLLTPRKLFQVNHKL